MRDARRAGIETRDESNQQQQRRRAGVRPRIGGRHAKQQRRQQRGHGDRRQRCQSPRPSSRAAACRAPRWRGCARSMRRAPCERRFPASAARPSTRSRHRCRSPRAASAATAKAISRLDEKAARRDGAIDDLLQRPEAGGRQVRNHLVQRAAQRRRHLCEGTSRSHDEARRHGASAAGSAGRTPAPAPARR